MTPMLAVITSIVVVVTATLSGIFGMAGGMILMAFLTFTYSVGAAMMLHGVTQAVSNGYRAVINRNDIVWWLVATNMAGSLAALALFMVVSFVPDKATVYLVLGAIPFVAFAIPLISFTNACGMRFISRSAAPASSSFTIVLFAIAP